MRPDVDALICKDPALGEVGEKCTCAQAEQEKNRIRYRPARVICSWYRRQLGAMDPDRGAAGVTWSGRPVIRFRYR